MNRPRYGALNLVPFDDVLKRLYPAPWDPPWRHRWAAFEYSWWLLSDAIGSGCTSEEEFRAWVTEQVNEVMGYGR